MHLLFIESNVILKEQKKKGFEGNEKIEKGKEGEKKKAKNLMNMITKLRQ
jgi:hypothetical protein